MTVTRPEPMHFRDNPHAALKTADTVVARRIVENFSYVAGLTPITHRTYLATKERMQLFFVNMTDDEYEELCQLADEGSEK